MKPDAVPNRPRVLAAEPVGAVTSDYSYDAFFSYKRDPGTDDWHRHVKQMLEDWLRQELGRPAKIFFDVEDIRTGTRFKEKIAESLRRSRCLVCLWSPLYFRSHWCVSEWLSFSRREELVNRELIVPASFHDGETFPNAAKKTQFKHFSEFASVLSSFWKTVRAVEFEQDLIRPFTRDLADKIRAAPPFDPNFPVVDAEDHEVQGELQIDRIADV